MTTQLKLGLKPATHDPRDLKFRTYATRAKLPKPPVDFGHYPLVERWEMLANDRYGDCAWAGPAHEVILLTTAAGRPVDVTEENVLSDYAAATGFNPADPNTDRGTDMREGAAYRQTTGTLDAAGERHKIGAYIWLDKGDIEQLAVGVWIFGTVGIGVRFPDSAMDQFEQGKPWDVVDGARVDGGHYIPVVGRNKEGNFLVVTWGKLQEMTPDFYAKYCDQALVYVSPDQLRIDGKTPDGFDNAQLASDLATLHAA